MHLERERESARAAVPPYSHTHTHTHTHALCKGRAAPTSVSRRSCPPPPPPPLSLLHSSSNASSHTLVFSSFLPTRVSCPFACSLAQAVQLALHTARARARDTPSSAPSSPSSPSSLSLARPCRPAPQAPRYLADEVPEHLPPTLNCCRGPEISLGAGGKWQSSVGALSSLSPPPPNNRTLSGQVTGAGTRGRPYDLCAPFPGPDADAWALCGACGAREGLGALIVWRPGGERERERRRGERRREERAPSRCLGVLARPSLAPSHRDSARARCCQSTQRVPQRPCFQAPKSGPKAPPPGAARVACACSARPRDESN
jgi:hypothetical protein